jgi:hypothetical protein
MLYSNCGIAATPGQELTAKGRARLQEALPRWQHARHALS